MVMLTATPHSGDDEAFHNLLALLRPDFRDLPTLPESQKLKLREELALHMVQRRRPDIAEWKDSTVFPDRETARSLTTSTAVGAGCSTRSWPMPVAWWKGRRTKACWFSG